MLLHFVEHKLLASFPHHGMTNVGYNVTGNKTYKTRQDL